MAPVIKAFRDSGLLEPVVAVTGQHRGMLDQVLDFFAIVPDYDLDLMTAGQSLCGLTARAIHGLERIVDDVEPDMVLVQALPPC